MSDASIAIAIATVVSAGVSAGAAYLTNRQSTKSNVEVAQTETRGDIELNAFNSAKGFYTDVIDRQDEEIKALEEKVSALTARCEAAEAAASSCQAELGHYKRTAKRLARGVYEHRRALKAMDIATPSDPELDDAVLELLGDNGRNQGGSP